MAAPTTNQSLAFLSPPPTCFAIKSLIPRSPSCQCFLSHSDLVFSTSEFHSAFQNLSHSLKAPSLSLSTPVRLPSPPYSSHKLEAQCQAEEELNFLLLEEKMITALRERRTEDAWQAFQVYSSRGHVPSAVCLSRLVSQLCYQGTAFGVSRAQKVAASLQRQDKISFLDCNALGLLAMASAKAGAARYGFAIIRMMFKMGLSPHVRAWSTVVSKLGSYPDDTNLALKIFNDICSRVQDNESKDGVMDEQIQSLLMKPDTAAFNAILNACATAGLSRTGEDLFRRLNAFGLEPDILTFNIMIKLYGITKQKGKLGKILDQMEQFSVTPDTSTMHSLVAAYVGIGDLGRAEQLVQALREGVGDIKRILKEDDKNNVDETNALTIEVTSRRNRELYAEEGGAGKTSVRQEKEEVDRIDVHSTPTIVLLEKSVDEEYTFKPDTRMYTILMKGYMQKGRFQDVIQLLIAMQREEDSRSKPNEVTYTTAITACVKLGLLDQGRALLREMALQNVPANVVSYNALLNGYCKASQIQKALGLMEEMKKVGIRPNVVSYNTLIDGCIGLDDNVRAIAFFTEMREAGIVPSNVSYTTLMKAFGRNGQPHLVARVFREMQQNPLIRVDCIAWNILIDSYCKAGQVEEAKDAFKKMKEGGSQPTVATYGSLVNCYAKVGKAGEALVLWNEIRERLEASDEDIIEPLKPDAGLLDGLVDTCVRAGFFQRALEIVSCMEKHQISADKIKYKRMFIELHSKLFTSKHASRARRDRSVHGRQALEAFKFWVGLPNKYYENDWSLKD